MDFQDFDRIEELFHKLKGLDEAGRATLLDSECTDRPDLRSEVESLLDAHGQATKSNFLGGPDENGAAELGQTQEDPHLLLGKHVGPYRIERYLGGGGMGDVYLAVRQAPFKVLVALKILRRGLRTDEVLKRFDVERQILASLSHPNIATLLDGGVTDDGLPYFAMEYVDGMPITRFADRNRLPVAERLKLFGEVCAAVNYAHRNLVIHRDLKPPNILVTNDGSVKLLDFGIAKIINPNLADLSTPITQTDYRMLTPDYASPEQVRAEPLSTASDVYSLGVILYELLSGRRPYRLHGNTAAEIERIVCDVDPLAPSRSGESASNEGASEAEVAHSRQVTPDRLIRQLRGDLDNIALMALRKEASRRYQSVEQLASDVENFLDGRPVSAAPDSGLYRAEKFLRRNTAAVAAVAAIGILLVGFSIYSSVQAKKLTLERDRVQLEAMKSQQVSDFVVGLFDMANPASAPGDTITVKSMLDAGVERAESELADQPALQAELFGVIGRAYENLGRHDRAIDLIKGASDLRRGVAGEEEAFLDDLRLLATLTAGSGRAKESEAAYREYIALGTERMGANHPEVLLERLYLLTLTHVMDPKVGADSILAIWGRLDSQLDRLTDTQAAAVLEYVTDIYFARGELEEAERVSLRAIEISTRAYGNQTTQLANFYNQLGWIYTEGDRPEDALDAGIRAAKINEVLHPDGHRSLAVSYGIQGDALSSLGRFDEAEEYLLRDLEMTRHVLGYNHYAVNRPLRFLGKMYKRRGDLDKAIQYYQEGIDIMTDRFGPDYLIVRQRELSIAELLVAKGEYAPAEKMLLDTYELFARTRGEDNASTVEVAQILSDMYAKMSRVEESARYAVLANAGTAPVPSSRD